MSFCCFDKGNLFVLFMCLLMIIGFTYIFNMRVSNIEKAVLKQNQVLSDFIINVKGDITSKMDITQNCNGGASQEAVDVARKLCASEKIKVSDSEDSSSDESDNISSSSMETDVEEVNIIETPTNEPQHSKLLDCGIFMINMSDTNKHSTQPEIVELIDDNKGQDSFSLSDLDNIEQLENLSDGSSQNKHSSIVETFDFTKMKITQLKEIATSKGLDTKGFKKNDLIEVLSKNKK